MGCAFSSQVGPNVLLDTANPQSCAAGPGAEICLGGNYTLSCPVGFTLLGEGGDVVPGGVFGGQCTRNTTDENQLNFIDLPGVSCARDAGMMGEPHIKKWNGEWYDWQGECDAVFLHAPDFRDGLGLDIHTRTLIRYWYSFIETAAVRIGSDIFEVGSWGDFTLNGVSSPEMPQVIGDCCTVTHTQTNENQRHLFSIDLGEDSSLELSTHKDIVSIKIIHQDSPAVEQWFNTSSGLMGSFQEGKSLARNGVSVLENPNDMGQEWQVLDSDPMLFQDSDRAPQFPQKCRLPDQDTEKKQRRLGEGITREAAAKACARWSEDLKENCIYDVMKTNDLGLAAFGGYF